MIVRHGRAADRLRDVPYRIHRYLLLQPLRDDTRPRGARREMAL